MPFAPTATAAEAASTEALMLARVSADTVTAPVASTLLLRNSALTELRTSLVLMAPAPDIARPDFPAATESDAACATASMVEAVATRSLPLIDKRKVRPWASTSTQPSSSCWRLKRTDPSIFLPTGSPVFSRLIRVVRIAASSETSALSITVFPPEVVIDVSVASFNFAAVSVSRATVTLVGGSASAVIERLPARVTRPAVSSLAVTGFSTSFKAKATPIETAVADFPMAAATEAASTRDRIVLLSTAEMVTSSAETEVAP